MLYQSSSNLTQRSQILELGNYEKLFRSPSSSGDNAHGRKGVLRPPIEPSPLSLDGAAVQGLSNSANNSHSHLISPNVYRLSASTSACPVGGALRSDTPDRDAALLLTSLKKLAVNKEETIDLSRMPLPRVPSLKPKNPGATATAATCTSSLSQLCSVYEGTFDQKNNDGSEGGIGTRIGTATGALGGASITSSSILRAGPRARAVSVDSHSHSHHFAPIYLENDCVASSFRTDALPREKICLDLTLDQKGAATVNLGAGVGMGVGTPAHISPPTSPILQSYKASKQMKGPQGLLSDRSSGSGNNNPSKKRQISHLKVAAGTERLQKKKKQRARPSILRASTKDIKQDADGEEKEKISATNSNDTSSTSTSTSSSRNKNNGNSTGNTDSNNKKILRKKFSWKSYPELESFLIANREEYLRHSAMNYTMQQKEYNNRLTERLLQLASECGYVFDEESFSFVSIRDRIRCYFKSYVQSKKKRGLILGYAARRKGLITEEELEKSAGIKGTIVVPKKSVHKKTKASSSSSSAL